MKGHMQEGNFHPHTPYKKTRKKRLDYTDEELVANIGVKLHKNNSGQIVRMKRDSKTDYYKSLNRQELESALVSKQKIIAGMDDILESKFQDKSSEHYRQGLRLQKQNKKHLEQIKKLLKKPRKKRFLTENDVDRLSDLQINVLLKEIEKRWDVEDLTALEGDHQVIIYTNKSDPSYTFELHPMDDNELEDESGNELEDPIYHNSWYFFPAKDGKGIPNSPTVISETGGYTRKDAVKEFNKEFIVYDQEFNS